MKTVILCGGFGSRIRDVSEDIPKPMIPIGHQPILWHIMRYYASFGHREFILCLGHKGQVIKDFFLNYESHTQDATVVLGRDGSVRYHGDHDEAGWEVTLANTGHDARTGARVNRIRKYLGDDEHFMLTYGDGVGDIDIEKLLAFHYAHGKILTVTGVHPPGRFGELRADAANVVTEFNEKPQTSAGRISGGFFVCRREIFHYLDDRDDLVFEESPMKRLVEESEMCVFEHDGFWQPMDTSREYHLLNEIFAAGNAPWVR